MRTYRVAAVFICGVLLACITTSARALKIERVEVLSGALGAGRNRPDQAPEAILVERRLVEPYLCRYAEAGFELDGHLGDWGDYPFIRLDRRDKVTSDSNQYPDTWKGPRDLSARVWLAWNHDGLLVAADITDDVHHQRASYGRYWDGDGLVLAFDPRSDASRSPDSGEDDREYYVALHDERGPEVVDYGAGQPCPGAKVAGRFTPTGYVLEALLPWQALTPLRPPARNWCGFAVLVNDSDGAGQEGWAENVHAIYGGSALDFATLVFEMPSVLPGRVYGSLYAGQAAVGADELIHADVGLVAGSDVAVMIEAARLSEGRMPAPAEPASTVGPVELTKGYNHLRITEEPLGDRDTALEVAVYPADAGARQKPLWRGRTDKVAVARAPALADLDSFRKRFGVKAVLGRIAADPAPPEGFSFAVLGDNRDGDRVYQQIMSRIESGPAKFSVIVGDIVRHGWVDEWLHWLALTQPFEKPVVPVIGNHDVGNSRQEWERLFGDLDFSFDYGGARFVCMDNSGAGFTDEQLAWADRTLADAKAKLLHTFVFMHKPPSTIEKWASHSFSANADEFVALMAKHRVDAVFCGHIHAFSTAVAQGVPYVLTGGGGAGMTNAFGPDGGNHHCIEVTVSPRGVTMRRLQLDWTERPVHPGHDGGAVVQ